MRGVELMLRTFATAHLTPIAKQTTSRSKTRNLEQRAKTGDQQRPLGPSAQVQRRLLR